LNLGCDLIIACNSTQKKILITEFPLLSYVELGGYDVKYAHNKRSTQLKILFQMGKILTRIKTENRWLDAFLKNNDVDALISDNRYGLHHPKLRTVLITHQLSVHSGYGMIADKISQKILYGFVNKFSECWVPDFEKNTTLAHKLSHPEVFPNVPVHYLGPLSRFEVCDHSMQTDIDILIVLSGPEPQRSILEKIMFDQLKTSEKKIAVVRGVPEELPESTIGDAIVYNHLDAGKFNRLVCSSQLVICRSGYSSIMDMIKLNKKLVVIPTPGQPEQEYLGTYLSQNGFAVCIQQHKFLLKDAEQLAAKFSFRHINRDMNEYKKVLKDFVISISS
jgi:uncharacterized protein (TIGR00661 family)